MGFIKSTSTKRGRKRERKEFKGVHITKTQIWNKRTTTGERGHMNGLETEKQLDTTSSQRCPAQHPAQPARLLYRRRRAVICPVAR